MRAIVFVVIAIFGYGQTAPPPAPAQPKKHSEDVNRHGDMAMGFSHLKTTHHFRLLAGGGAIEVQADNPTDREPLDLVRMHLQHTAQAFAEGDFRDPTLTHSRTPPGVPAMRRLKSQISYRYEETGNGARILITTANPDALKAVHAFLRFQIDDHRTGDPKTVADR